MTRQEREGDLRPPPSTSAFVRDDRGRQFRLQQRLGSGGEGAVFAVNDDVACKVFERRRLTRERIKKIEGMVSNPFSHPSVCWPRSLVYDAGQPVGYLMARATGFELQTTVFVKPRLEKVFPRWNRKQLVQLAISMLQPIASLHRHGVLVGDLNPRNILVRDHEAVFFVDTDSYQVFGFPCPVGMSPFLAPDLLGKDLKTTRRTIEHERFALATLLFMLMLPGKAPYSHEGGGDPATSVKTGHFPYCLGESGHDRTPRGPWRLIWSHLTYEVKEAFHNAFARRVFPDAEEWSEIFERYLHAIQRGYVTDELFPKRLKSPKCLQGTNPATTRKCKVCANDFYITTGEQRWFEAKSMSLPKRCQQCRAYGRKAGPSMNNQTFLS